MTYKPGLGGTVEENLTRKTVGIYTHEYMVCYRYYDKDSLVIDRRFYLMDKCVLNTSDSLKELENRILESIKESIDITCDNDLGNITNFKILSFAEINKRDEYGRLIGSNYIEQPCPECGRKDHKKED